MEESVGAHATAPQNRNTGPGVSSHQGSTKHCPMKSPQPHCQRWPQAPYMDENTRTETPSTQPLDMRQSKLLPPRPSPLPTPP